MIEISQLKLSKLENFNIIHYHSSSVPLFPLITQSIISKPSIFHDYGIVPLKFIGNLRNIVFSLVTERLNRCFLSTFSSVVTINNFLANELKKYHPKEVKVVPGGVEHGMFHPLECSEVDKYRYGEPQLLYVGSYTYHKNVDFLIECLPVLLKKWPHLKLVIVGHGDPIRKNYLLTKANCLNVHYALKLIENVDTYRLSLLYNASDVFITASYWEGFCLPIIEAMACGKPVIARDSFATGEHVKKSGGGELFVKNSWEVLLALDRILANYKQYSINALRYANNFSWDKSAKLIRSIYISILQNE